VSTTVIHRHQCRKEHQRPCEWCGEKISPGDYWIKNVTMGGEFSAITFHEECHDAFQGEFQHYFPGSLLAIETYANDRGQEAKEGTVYEV